MVRPPLPIFTFHFPLFTFPIAPRTAATYHKTMPPPPRIASITGQRAAVAAAMAVLLTCSLAAAYAYAHMGAPLRGQRAAGDNGSIHLSLGQQWQAQEDRGAWAQLLPAATVLADVNRPSRQLVISPLADNQPIEPQQLTVQLLKALTPGEISQPVMHVLHDSRTHMTYFELYAYSQETDSVVMHLFAVVGGGERDRTHEALIYMRDVIDDEMMSRYNLLLFRSIYRSATLP